MRRTTPLAAVAFASAVLLLLAGCSAAALLGEPAASSRPAPTERDGWTDDTNSAAYQHRAAEEAEVDRYLQWLGAQPHVHAKGYMAGVVDAKHLTATLLWYGHDPYEAVAVAAGRRFGITVRIQQRTRSIAQLVAEQRRVIAVSGRFAALGFRLRGVSGLAAQPQPLTISGTVDPFSDRAAVRRLAAEAAGEPVQVEALRPYGLPPGFFGPFPIRSPSDW